MTADKDREVLGLTDVDTTVYETVANLEYTGRPMTRSEIAASTDLDDKVLDETLAGLVRRGLLVTVEADGGPAFEPADRGWSAAPDQGHGLRGL